LNMFSSVFGKRLRIFDKRD